MSEPYLALAELSKSYGHHTRLRILDILARDEACVCHLTALLGEAQAHVSQHLRVLRDGGLVVDRRDGVMVYYRLADARAAAVVSILKDLQRLAAPDVIYPTISDSPVAGCPCPHCTAAAPNASGKDCC